MPIESLSLVACVLADAHFLIGTVRYEQGWCTSSKGLSVRSYVEDDVALVSLLLDFVLWSTRDKTSSGYLNLT
jgi:hypothetical protein